VLGAVGYDGPDVAVAVDPQSVRGVRGRNASPAVVTMNSARGKYKKEQAPLFAFALTIQWLSTAYAEFLQQFGQDVAAFHDVVFKSVRLHALVLFYKYYLGGRTPTKPSDFGDLSHLYALPYSVIAVVERDMANTLQQIQRHDRVLADTNVLDIDFLQTLGGTVA
jgi:hypothetical protein